ncbi:MAG: hypothetical protein EU541_06885 [Promethearchaeota archaeon]|nr:MAG: hypothetical protein EU541_06885 [Candidatus Lokiarchaeota archaeon]
MPELPSVEDFRKEIDPNTINKKISDVRIIDDYILKTPKKRFKEEMVGKIIKSTSRRGKYIFIEIDGKYVLLHFGMSGEVKFYKRKSEQPEYSKIIIEFSDNTFLSIISIRKFGKVELIDDYKTYVNENEIGPDALDVSLEEFKEIMDYKKRSYAKNALMDQSAISGIGNIFSDELLFQVNVFPKTKISQLETEKIEQMYSVMKDILKVAIESRLSDKPYPNDFIIPHRSRDDNCPVCSTNIKRLKISSRHAFYCPKCQIK